MPQQVQQQQIGIVCPVPLGEYNTNTAYQKLNIVTYNESTFIAKIGNQGIKPLDDDGWENYWMKIAAGEGIASTEVSFQIGENGTVPPVGEWSNKQIEPVPGKYFWTKVVITYTDKTSKEVLFATYEGQDAGFGTISAKATSIDPKLPATATVEESGDNTAKNLTFSFEIPKGVPAGFGKITAEANKLAPKSAPTASVKESGTNEEKNLAFSFGIPEGVAAGFGEITATAKQLKSNEQPTASVEEGGTNEEKDLAFTFCIPEGEAAGFGEITADATQLSSDAKPTASVEESGTNAQKNLAFHFGLVNGKDAGFGTVSAEAQGLEAGEAPTAEVEVSGEDTKKNFAFKFKLPKSSPFDYDSLAPEQQAALNSGVTSDKVSQITKNEQAIAEESSRAQGAEQANAKAIADETARAEGVEGGLDTRVQAIEDKIPAQASEANKLADQAFVNSSINALAAFFITPTASGDKAFATRAALLAATTFYSGGKERVPTQNDYAVVLADESQEKGANGTYPTTRYSYQGGTYPSGQWAFQYIVNNTSLTQAQVDAINSGITASGVGQITTNKNDIAAIKTKNTEQDTAIGNAQSRADVSVRYDISQSLTDAQKRQARQNIGAGDSGFSGNYNDLSNKPAAVLYTSQSLTSTQQQQARANIGAGTSNFSGSYSDLSNKPSAVLYTSQSLTSAQQQQARANIGAGTSNFSGSYSDLSSKPNNLAKTDASQTFTGGNLFTGRTRFGENVNNCIEFTNTQIKITVGDRGYVLNLPAQGGTLALKEDDYYYKKGALYLSYDNSTSPVEKYGGSWSPLKGQFLYFGEGGDLGGDNKITLKEENLPAMSLRVNKIAGDNSIKELTTGDKLGSAWDGGQWGILGGYYKADTERGELYAKKTTAAKSIDFMPNYCGFYAWVRTTN